MAEKDKIITDLSSALKNGQTDEAKQMTQKVLDQGMEPLAIIEKILVPALTEIGQKFQDFEIFLPELMMAGEAAEAMTAIVEKATLDAGQPSLNKGTVILGQVEGDMHDIGRNIVGTLLKSHGFKVVDMGRDVPASAFLDAAEKEEADIIALSAHYGRSSTTSLSTGTVSASTARACS